MEDPRERIESLEAQLQRMRSIFRRTSEALFCWEMVRPVPIDAPIEAQIEGLADGVLVECNEVAAIGYGYASAAEILGKHSNEVWQRPPPNHAQLLRAFCAANYELTGFRLSVDYPDGSTRVFENEVFGVVEDGAVVRTWGSARDVTDRLNLEAELIRAQKLDAVGRLAGAVAHDYNNLLTAILGGLDLLREIPGDAELLAMVTSAAERSAKLTRRMLGLSRHAVVQRRATAVAEVLGGLEGLLGRLLAPDVRLRVAVTEAAQGARVFMDGTHLEQVVLNLVVNARDAARAALDDDELADGAGQGARGLVVVELDVADGGEVLVLRVIDRGVGMSPEVQARVFEPFFTTKAAGEGTGLGLDTVRRIVDDTRGTVRFESAPGQGCTVEVRLPTCEPETGRLVPQSIAERASVVPGTRVLVVDDEPAVRSFMGQSLRLAGYDAWEFDGPAAAVEALDRGGEDVALVVTDVQMRGSSGPTFARRLRLTHPSLPVLFVSGFAPEELGLEGGSRRAFLAKPFGRATLLDAVATLIAEAASS